MLRLRDFGANCRLLLEVPLAERVALHHDGQGSAVPHAKAVVRRRRV